MRYFKVLLVFLLPLFLSSQDFSNQWTGHYSYFQINDLYATDDKVYAASENAIFIYDTQSESIDTFSTVNGLSGEIISSIYHSSVYNITAIGYENGLLEVITDDNDVTTFIDIVEKPTIPPTEKRINHFFENGNILYVSTGFGIVEFNLENIEFGDTFFVGPGGSQINITGTAVLDNSIYATTPDNGILRADVNNPNLVDFNQWSTVVGGNFNGILNFNNQIIVWQNTNLISRLNGNTVTTVITATSNIQDFTSDDQNLTLALGNRSLTYDVSFQQITSVVSNVENTFSLNSSIIFNNNIYLGTNSRGLLQINTNSSNSSVSVTPEGPLLNSPFGIEANNNDLWVVYGEYDAFYNPSGVLRGISRFKSEGWINITDDKVLNARALSAISVNPANEEQVFISSFQDGLLEINNNEVTNLYNSVNSGFETLVPGSEVVRLNGSVFDDNGDLWIVNSRIVNGLKRFSPSTAQTFNVNLSSVISNALDDLGFSDVVLNREGNVFFGTNKNGVIGYNVDSGRLIKLAGKGEGADLPDDFIQALEIDKNNQLWIGTRLGLRVLFNSSGAFQQANPQTNQIIILDEEGVPQELLFGQGITDIEVDGSNNKWVATGSSGVFYFSSDGQETLAHFTKENSPLPSNNVRDVTVDDTTGAVFFATVNGLLEFKGTATGPESDLENVVAFPNPVRPGFNGRVTIRGLTRRANVKITDIEGNLVHEEVSEGGSIQWDTTAFGRHKVASGVYLILVTGEDQGETTVSKLLIVR
ncbi:two-component regulator propeller domain-containing protein [Aquimarina sp. 2201CG5-10]|uniref:type IX secretion system anionic LPS delivery protein PorZ n=1 Tax=Aquimarina callyspongiae TaxID=3098150 RepID=UPI002AB4D457|nr:two-component regulator propeller domain-containing protein [Aquimarina sp. 2201CG5-10]MDY8137107.1 two-component regulator propeller domain-containing protein [Aquimarina sp. 2201CG5-10]